MDVILVKDLDRVGKSGVIVHVKPGFARNYLIPQGLALLATPEQVRQVQERQRQAGLKAERALKHAQAFKQRLEQHALHLKLTVGEHDEVFGSVTAHDIAEALANDDLAVEKHAIQLDEPIKTLGVYDVPVRLHPEVTATLKVWVVKA